MRVLIVVCAIATWAISLVGVLLYGMSIGQAAGEQSGYAAGHAAGSIRADCVSMRFTIRDAQKRADFDSLTSSGYLVTTNEPGGLDDWRILTLCR